MVVIFESLFSALVVLGLCFKIKWLLAILLIIGGVIGILATIFKWEEVLFYNHFWIDLDDNKWFRVLNGMIGFLFVVGGVCWLATELKT